MSQESNNTVEVQLRLDSANLTPEQCQRYESCSCPLCPLDDLEQRTYVKGEAVCPYVLAHVKDDVPGCNPLDQAIVKAVEDTLPTMERIGGAGFRTKLREALQRAERKAA